MKRKTKIKLIRLRCRIWGHNWEKANTSNLGFRIKSICRKCGKVETLKGKKIYLVKDFEDL